MTQSSQTRKNLNRSEELEDPVTFEDHLEELNEALGDEQDLKKALNLAKKKLRKSVGAEISLRDRLRENQSRLTELEGEVESLTSSHKEEIAQLKGSHKEALEASETRFTSLDTEYRELTLKANLIAEGVNPDRLGQAERLINDPRYFKETDGVREYDFDFFKEENDNIFLDEPVNPFTSQEDLEEELDEEPEDEEPAESPKQRREREARETSQNLRRTRTQETVSPDTDDEPGDNEPADDEPESRPFVRQRGQSVSESPKDFADKLSRQRYKRPSFGE